MDTPQLDILVIGTEPPCPRCDLLLRRVIEIAGDRDDVSISHCAFDASPAIALGIKLNRKIGTAKHVAQDTGIEINWAKVYKVIQDKRILCLKGAPPADAWSPELDRLLNPCSDAAESAGYIMTPALIINGNVAHHGDVPPPKEIMRLLRRFL